MFVINKKFRDCPAGLESIHTYERSETKQTPQIRTDQPESTDGDENGFYSRRSSGMDDRRPSLRRVDQEGLL
ncbi:unnamed protein product, partial [Rotaria magnacalcarata]